MNSGFELRAVAAVLLGVAIATTAACHRGESDAATTPAASVAYADLPVQPQPTNEQELRGSEDGVVVTASPGLVPEEVVVDAGRDRLFQGPALSLPVELLGFVPDAPIIGVVDVSALRARWPHTEFAAFGLQPDIDPLLQRLASLAGVRLLEPDKVTAIAASYDETAGTVVFAARGSEMQSIGSATVRQAGDVAIAQPGPTQSGAPATAALGTALPPSAIAVVRVRAAESLPALLADGFRVGWASDDTVWIDLSTQTPVDGWVGRGQAFASQALGQLRSTTPAELQAGVTLLTRWQEALWALVRVEEAGAYTRLGLPAPRCGGVARNALSGALLLGWMDAASNDPTLALRPRVPMQASIQAGCPTTVTTASLPRELGALGDGRVASGEQATVLLGDATALLRAWAPGAGGVLPFALPGAVVVDSLGQRPLGVDSLAAAAPVAFVAQGPARAMVLPIGTANALGPTTLIDGGVPRLLDASGVLISRAGSGFMERLAAEDSRWRDAAMLLPPDAAWAALWAPASPWHGTEVLALAWTPNQGFVLAGAPVGEGWSAHTLGARLLSLAGPGLPAGRLEPESLARLERALSEVEVRTTEPGWSASIGEAAPWVPIGVELGLAIWGGGIDRGPIRFPVSGPISPGLQFNEPPPRTARP